MTPLQELLNWVDQELRLDGYEHKEIMLKILELKDKEEKMVVDAWEDGRLNEGTKGSQNYFDKRVHLIGEQRI
jgi:hypothetical protein